MTNPLLVAASGKGLAGLFRRANSILGRYGSTAIKMSHSFALLENVLQQYRIPATLPITAVTLGRHKAVMQSVREHNIELAVHGLTHVDFSRLDFDTQLDHLRRALQIFKQAGLAPAGFRSPYLRWNEDTLVALRACGFEYESSQALAWEMAGGIETDAYRRVLDFYHSQPAATYPSLPRLEDGLVRIPYCLPDDEALVERLHLSGPVMAEVWVDMLDRIHQAGELFTLGLHPERSALCQEALQAVLVRTGALTPGVWIASLKELAAWYRNLGQATFQATPTAGGMMQIAIQAPARAAILVRSLNPSAPALPWGGGYEKILKNEFSVQTEKRPFIGLPPDAPASLRDFLQHQGYLVEMSTDSQNYACYLHLRHFSRQDERPLLAEIEEGSWPLVRLGRWPDGTQSALAVTGDIDAITLFDYALRVVGG